MVLFGIDLLSASKTASIICFTGLLYQYQYAVPELIGHVHEESRGIYQSLLVHNSRFYDCRILTLDG